MSDGRLSWPWVAGWLHTEINVRHRELNPDTADTSIFSESVVRQMNSRQRRSLLAVCMMDGEWTKHLATDWPLSILMLASRLAARFCPTAVVIANLSHCIICRLQPYQEASVRYVYQLSACCDKLLVFRAYGPGLSGPRGHSLKGKKTWNVVKSSSLISRPHNRGALRIVLVVCLSVCLSVP